MESKSKLVTLTQGFGVKRVRRVVVNPGHILYTATVRAAHNFDGGVWFMEYRTFAKGCDADVLGRAEVL